MQAREITYNKNADANTNIIYNKNTNANRTKHHKLPHQHNQ